ncbi:hypothetical protein HX004_17025 [Myroides sp. 1354]|uniref:hypothetical protein n=1 Tax=unclassified Myroides TaxID=2642485 RepID=UPI0025756CBF|nr:MULTISPECIES: hypothetical protein [unclassified Myroides]MDM1046539.1 hypothetical protein [Myroides sp. R163-1]MDM1057460.1 hypothetical protein [Myroides sp. 1354]MDM1070745.1 hypothetical protein [Myroides sp. 1372]
MILNENPITKTLHSNWRLRIQKEFPSNDFTSSIDYLCLINYLDKVPQKFYSKQAFVEYLDFLETAKKLNPKLLANILITAETLLSLSNKTLTTINDKSIHDILLPTDNNDLIDFIEREIHYNLLNIYETPFYQFTRIITEYKWIESKKNTDGLDLFNSIEYLKKSNFNFINNFYLHNVRNGIAHGKIVFSDRDITYIDKKGGKAKVGIKKIIDIFDGILDITNGFCLAFKVFAFTNSTFFEKYQIPIPQSILLEELQAKVNVPAWTIKNCLESNTIDNKKQLIVYINNKNWDYNKVLYYSFTTALWAESLIKSYDRIFLSFHSKYSKTYPIGWASYDANKLKYLRNKNETNFEAYKGVLENDLLAFDPKFKLPKFIYKLGTFNDTIRSSVPIILNNYLETYFPDPFYIRETQIHSKKFFTIIQDTSLVVKTDCQISIENLIRKDSKRIIKKAIRYSRKQCSWFSKEKYLPVKYIRVFIYSTDKRLRNLRNSGLPPSLVATIEINKTKHIKTIDILGGTPEQNGRYRIVWNKSFLENK